MLLGTALLFVLRQKRWPLLLLPMILVANVVVMGLHGSRSDLFIWHRYYLTAYTMAILLAACGWQWLCDWAGERVGQGAGGVVHAAGAGLHLALG